jgi:hypothetical protein
LTGYPEKLLKGKGVTVWGRPKAVLGDHMANEKLTSCLLRRYHAVYAARGRRPSLFVILRACSGPGRRLLRCAFS